MSFVSIKYRFLICFMKYSDDITSNTLSSPSCWMMVYKKTQLTKFFFYQRQLQSGGFHEPLALSDISVFMYASLEVLMKSHLKSVTE